MLLATTRKGVYNNTKMQRQVSGMHIAHGFMRRRSQDFALGWPNCKSHANVMRNFQEEELFIGQRIKDQKLRVWFGTEVGFC